MHLALIAEATMSSSVRVVCQDGPADQVCAEARDRRYFSEAAGALIGTGSG